MFIVYTTCANTEEAKKISKLLIDRKLAACVEFWEVGSMYTWKGEFKAVKETMLAIKTLENRLPLIEQLMEEHHSYSAPQIAAMEVKRINRPYKEWMTEVMG